MQCLLLSEETRRDWFRLAICCMSFTGMMALPVLVLQGRIQGDGVSQVMQ
jgi:hypothetical protein